MSNWLSITEIYSLFGVDQHLIDIDDFYGLTTLASSRYHKSAVSK